MNPEKPEYFDYNLLAGLLLLSCFGLVMLYSTSAYTASVKHGDDMFFFGKQAFLTVCGFLWALAVSKIDYHKYYKTFASILYVVSCFLMFLVLTPLGVEINGARRWLKIGVQFQPSEITKLAIILLVPCYIIKMGKNMRKKENMIVLFGIALATMLMTHFFTDNLSTALIIGGIVVGLIFIAHPLTKPFIITLVLGVTAVAGGVWGLSKMMENSESFRIRRVLVWLHPEEHLDSGGYQVMQGLYAIGSGGFFGKGLGNSVQKLGAVPEAQNDMIFSIVCEELGLWGAGLVLILFGYLLYRLLFIAQNAADLYGSLIVAGIFIHIALQVILNICVVLNLIPTTGITLPFFSYGGTSIMFLMTEMGVALNVSTHIRFRQPETIPWA